MGKAKKSRRGRVRHQPIPEPSQQDTTNRNNLLIDITSLSDSKRENACSIISSITEFNPQLVTSELVIRLNTRIVDSNIRVRIAAANAVRNIAAEYSLYSKLISAGTVLVVMNILSEFKVDDSNLSNLEATYIIHLIHILTNLCANDEEAMSKSQFFSFVQLQLDMLLCSTLPPTIRRVSAYALFILTDDGQATCEHLQHSFDKLSILVQIAMEDDNVQLRLHVIAILLNCTKYGFPLAENVLQQFVHYLSSTLGLVYTSDKADNVDSMDLIADESKEEEILSHEEKSTELGAALEVVKLSAEISANLVLLLSNEEEEEEVQEDWASDDEGEAMVDVRAKAIVEDEAWHVVSGQLLSAALSSLTSLYALIEGFTQKATTVPLPAESSTLMRTIESLHSVAANVFLDPRFSASTLTTEFTSHTSALLLNHLRLILHTFEHCVLREAQQSEVIWLFPGDVNMPLLKYAVIAATSATCGCLFAAIKAKIFVSASDAKALATTLLQAINIPILSVCQPCIECMGALGETTVLTVPIATIMTNALLLRLQDPKLLHIELIESTSSTLMVMDACICALIDIHASDDPSLLACFVKFNCLTVLEQMCSDFQSRLKAEGASLPKEDRLKCKETALNLKRFVKYKKAIPK